MKLVPEKITPEMEQAARLAMFKGPQGIWDAILATLPDAKIRRSQAQRDSERLDWLDKNRPLQLLESDVPLRDLIDTISSQ